MERVVDSHEMVGNEMIFGNILQDNMDYVVVVVDDNLEMTMTDEMNLLLKPVDRIRVAKKVNFPSDQLGHFEPMMDDMHSTHEVLEEEHTMPLDDLMILMNVMNVSTSIERIVIQEISSQRRCLSYSR